MRHPVNTHEPEGVRGGSGALRAQGELKLGSKNNLICYWNKVTARCVVRVECSGLCLSILLPLEIPPTYIPCLNTNIAKGKRANEM